jgi:hypothetical protein
LKYGKTKAGRVLSWNIVPCSLLKVNRCFGGTCRIHVQGRRLYQHKAVSK